MSLVHQAQILNGDAGLLQGSRSSVVRASTAKVGGLGSIPSGYPSFFLQYVPILIYHQLLTNSSVVVIRIVTKIIMHVIGASLSEPHIDRTSGRFSIYYDYVIIIMVRPSSARRVRPHEDQEVDRK